MVFIPSSFLKDICTGLRVIFCFRGALVHCWGQCNKMVQSLWNTVCQFLKIKTESPHDPTIPLGVYLKELKAGSLGDICQPRHFANVTPWKLTRYRPCPPALWRWLTAPPTPSTKQSFPATQRPCFNSSHDRKASLRLPHCPSTGLLSPGHHHMSTVPSLCPSTGVAPQYSSFL